MKNLLGTTAALLLAVVVHAQVTVKGTVKNGENTPLPGATITVSGNGRQFSTTSNGNGNFSISEVPENITAVIKATYINKQPAVQNISIHQEDVTVYFVLPDGAYALEPLEVQFDKGIGQSPFYQNQPCRSRD